MKIALTSVFLLFLHSDTFPQATEFPASTKGLMYSDNTINKLTFIVDSLNNPSHPSPAIN